MTLVYTADYTFIFLAHLLCSQIENHDVTANYTAEMFLEQKYAESSHCSFVAFCVAFMVSFFIEWHFVIQYQQFTTLDGVLSVICCILLTVAQVSVFVTGN